MTAHDYDVLVVGAGPSGLTTAASLVRFGIRVLVVEKHPGLSIFPKAIGVRARSMEIFRSWGLEADIRSRSQNVRTTMRVGPALIGPGQEVSLGLPDAETMRSVSPVGVALCGQDQLEEVLYADVVARGGEVRFRTELIGLDHAADGVQVTLRHPDGEVRTLRTRYLVGADGGRSRVRSLIGVDFTWLGTESDHLSVLFRADLSAVMPEPHYVLDVVTDPEANGLFASTAMTDRWVWDMDWHPESGERVEHWTPERITALLRRATGLPALEPEIVALFPWTFGAGIAHGYRRGPVFLVGDAAHRTTPRGSTGMNTGIADAHNLGWKLAWVIKGWAAEPLLDSYEAEREPVGRANATASLQPTVDQPRGDGLAHDFGVTYRSGAVVGETELAGRRAPHAWVQTGSRALSPSKGQSSSTNLSTLDLFDGRFTLITGADGAGWRNAATGLPISVLSLGRELADPVGELATRYALTDRGGVLVRPDGYVAWQADAYDDGAGDHLRDAFRLATGHRLVDLVR